MLCPFTAVAEPSDSTVNYGHSQPAEICPYSSALTPEAAWPLASPVHPLTALRAHAGLAATDGTAHFGAILNHVVFKGYWQSLST